MGDLEIDGPYGWEKLEDLIPGRENCDKCGEEGDAEGAGYQRCDPPELIIWFCRKCRNVH